MENVSLGARSVKRDLRGSAVATAADILYLFFLLTLRCLLPFIFYVHIVASLAQYIGKPRESADEPIEVVDRLPRRC